MTGALVGDSVGGRVIWRVVGASVVFTATTAGTVDWATVSTGVGGGVPMDNLVGKVLGAVEVAGAVVTDTSCCTVLRSETSSNVILSSGKSRTGLGASVSAVSPVASVLPAASDCTWASSCSFCSSSWALTTLLLYSWIKSIVVVFSCAPGSFPSGQAQRSRA